MFDGLTMPFTVAEVMDGAFSLLKVIGPFIAITIALSFVPRIVSVLRGAAAGGGRR